MRLRYKPWASDYINENKKYVKLAEDAPAGRWRKEFGNDRPLHVEVGTGKGKFLNDMSLANPDISYVGVEVYDSVLVTGVQRAVEEEPDNLCFINGDVFFLEDMFAENEVDKLYINFTDPWPKKRHEKRRLTYSIFLELYKKVLKPDGIIQFKTDNQGLFEYSLESMSQFGMKLETVRLDLHHSEEAEGNIMTEYEAKFSEKGQPIYMVCARFQ